MNQPPLTFDRICRIVISSTKVRRKQKRYNGDPKGVMMAVNQNPQVLHHKALKALSPSLRYDGTIPFPEWQKSARERLAALLGMHKLTPAAQDTHK